MLDSLEFCLAEYELISSIVENVKDVILIDVKEKLLEEYEQLEGNRNMRLRSTLGGSREAKVTIEKETVRLGTAAAVRASDPSVTKPDISSGTVQSIIQTHSKKRSRLRFEKIIACTPLRHSHSTGLISRSLSR